MTLMGGEQKRHEAVRTDIIIDVCLYSAAKQHLQDSRPALA
jgi:hypothetical protein